MSDRPSATPSSGTDRSGRASGARRESAHRRALARHEALCSLMDELRALDDLSAIAERLALRWPQVAPVGGWRLVLVWGEQRLLLQAVGAAGQLQWLPALPAWEKAQWQRPSRSRLLPSDLQQAARGGLALPQALLAGRQPPEVLLLPLHRQHGTVGLASLVPRADPFSAQDIKFCQLLARQLADHLLLLMADRAQAELARLRDRLTRDPVTGAFNLAGVLEQLLTQLALAQRMGQHLSVLLVDLLPYHAVLASHGPAVADELLRHVMRSLALASRAGDHVARTHGGTFLFVLYPCDGEQVLAAAQRLLLAVAERGFALQGVPGGMLTPSLQLGAASSQGCAQPTAEWLIQHAEKALHEARRAGPGRVVLAGSGGTIAPALPSTPLYPPPQPQPQSRPLARPGAATVPTGLSGQPFEHTRPG